MIQDHVFACKASNYVNVTTCSVAVVITGESSLDPNGLVGAKLLVDLGFYFLFGPRGVSPLAQLHSFGK